LYEVDHVVLNSSFALANIAADKDAQVLQRLIESQIFKTVVEQLTGSSQGLLSKEIRFELTYSLANFFIHADFDSSFLLLSSSDRLMSYFIDTMRESSGRHLVSVIVSLDAVDRILSKARAFAFKARSFHLK
jgi:hypothetical protein